MIDLFSVTDECEIFGQPVRLLDNVDLHLPVGRYALLSHLPEARRYLIDVLAGIRPPRQGSVVIDRSISWPIGRASIMRGRATGLDVITLIADLYDVDVDDAGDLVTFLVSRPEYIGKPVDSWPPYVRQEFNFALGLVPNFDIYVVDAAMPFEETRFSRLWQALFEERVVGKTLILSSVRPKQLLDFCAKALVHDNVGLSIDDDLEQCIERYPPRPAREDIGSIDNAGIGHESEFIF